MFGFFGGEGAHDGPGGPRRLQLFADDEGERGPDVGLAGVVVVEVRSAGDSGPVPRPAPEGPSAVDGAPPRSAVVFAFGPPLLAEPGTDRVEL